MDKTISDPKTLGFTQSQNRITMDKAEEIYWLESSDRGGKAGRGHNKTKTIQVYEGSCIIRQFKFRVGNVQSRAEAVLKAMEYIRNLKGGNNG